MREFVSYRAPDAVSDRVSEFVNELLAAHRLKNIFLVVRTNRSRQFIIIHRGVFLLNPPKARQLFGIVDAKLHRIPVDPGDD